MTFPDAKSIKKVGGIAIGTLGKIFFAVLTFHTGGRIEFRHSVFHSNIFLCVAFQNWRIPEYAGAVFLPKTLFLSFSFPLSAAAGYNIFGKGRKTNEGGGLDSFGVGFDPTFRQWNE